MNSNSKKQSRYEQIFERKLIEKGLIRDKDYLIQYEIPNCPFNNNDCFACDFYFPERKLYVEVKGIMSLYTCSQLLFLSRKQDINFYILQLSNEDWMNSEIIKAGNNCTIKNIREAQFREFFDESETGASLAAKSRRRLSEYLYLRITDVYRWERELNDRKK